MQFQPNDRRRPESYGRRGASPRTGPTQRSSAGWCQAALLLSPPGGTETPGKKLHPGVFFFTRSLGHQMVPDMGPQYGSWKQATTRRPEDAFRSLAADFII